MNGQTNIQLLAIITFTCVGFWLSLYDMRFHRLPNVIVGWLSIALVLISMMSDARLHVVATAVLHTAFYGFLYVLSRGQLGMGDVKYAFPTGLTAALAGVTLTNLVILTFVVAGISCIALIAIGRATRHSRIAFGPFMTLGVIGTVLIRLIP